MNPAAATVKKKLKLKLRNKSDGSFFKEKKQIENSFSYKQTAFQIQFDKSIIGKILRSDTAI